MCTFQNEVSELYNVLINRVSTVLRNAKLELVVFNYLVDSNYRLVLVECNMIFRVRLIVV